MSDNKNKILIVLTLLITAADLEDFISNPDARRLRISHVRAGTSVLNQPFFSRGNIATAGGCLASQYLAFWVIARLSGIKAAEAALHYVAPVREKDEYLARARRNVQSYVTAETNAA